MDIAPNQNLLFITLCGFGNPFDCQRNALPLQALQAQTTLIFTPDGPIPSSCMPLFDAQTFVPHSDDFLDIVDQRLVESLAKE